MVTCYLRSRNIGRASGMIATFVLCSMLSSAFAGEPQPRLGMNLSGPADWSTELAFADVFRLSRTWISQRQGEAWGKGPPLELDAHGWVKRIETGCWAETPLCTVAPNRYPSGEYTVLYEGQGKIEFWGAATALNSERGRHKILVDASRGGFFLRIRETNPQDYIRNIRVLLPGCEKTWPDNPWNPKFLALWQGQACLRFMDMMLTNNSKVVRWEDRPTVEDATFTVKGVPAELLVDLANRQKADAWFCMPHRADDDYIRRFAQLVKSTLDPQRRVVIEYSNEVWNGQFEQHRYAAEQGQRLKFSEKPWEAAWYYTARRSLEIFKIWEEVFGGNDRFIRVLPTQSANSYLAEQIAGFEDAYRHADALAIAPYLSLNLAPNSNPSAVEVSRWTVEQVLDHMENVSLPESAKWIDENKRVADRYQLRLIAYEGGQHMVGVAGGENNEALTALLHQANAHPRMESIYDQYLLAWEKAGGDLFCHFSSVGSWSKWGSWGLLQSLEEDPKQSPKFRAVERWRKRTTSLRSIAPHQ